jgi:hypothetical protein
LEEKWILDIFGAQMLISVNFLDASATQAIPGIGFHLRCQSHPNSVVYGKYFHRVEKMMGE